jgi:hypothetical protein
MSPDAQRILDEVRQLPPDERHWFLEQLLAQENEDAFAAMEAELGEPEPRHDAWVRAGIEEALVDNSGDVSHEEAMRQLHEAILNARKLKATA